ncbi:uncharacterized protein LOC62_03G004098 [Vanrija pseudolonga]|uniref:Uncharacterized protein n=1 Tax=Vanrija pseudolonga TaxID=143232 RepID=A0AAF0YBG7_9TREE|nr:hypothetical protein LOC62_03G004098 [Vanrija pseudolonga]
MSHNSTSSTPAQGTLHTAAEQNGGQPTFANHRVETLFRATTLTKLAFQFAVAEVGRSERTTPNRLRVVVLNILRSDEQPPDSDDELLERFQLGRVPQNQLENALKQFKMPFGGRPSDEVAKEGQEEFRVIQATLRLLVDVFAAYSIYMFRAFLTTSGRTPHDLVRADLARPVPDELLDAWAGVTRLCVAASVNMAYRTPTPAPTSADSNNLAILNQQPEGDSFDDQLSTLADRYLSHGFDLEGDDWVPQFSPARKTCHPHEAAWRVRDRRMTDEVAEIVAKKRGISIDALTRTVRLTPYHWASNYSAGEDEEGVQVIFDIIDTLKANFGRGYGRLDNVWDNLHIYLDPCGAPHSDSLPGSECDSALPDHFDTKLKTLVEEEQERGYIHPRLVDDLFPEWSLSSVYQLVEKKTGSDLHATGPSGQ